MEAAGVLDVAMVLCVFIQKMTLGINRERKHSSRRINHR